MVSFRHLGGSGGGKNQSSPSLWKNLWTEAAGRRYFLRSESQVTIASPLCSPRTAAKWGGDNLDR
jgi:hypothetical protein